MGDLARRLETDESSVQLVTIHRSKGLEYPVVFCAFAWEGERKDILPVFHRGDDMIMDLGSDGIEESLGLAHEEQFAEDLRLLYVALTRSRFRCYLYWGRFAGSESSALAYLIHRPPLEGCHTPLEVTKRCMSSMDASTELARLQRLEELSCGSITVVTDSPEPFDISNLATPAHENLAAVVFKREIERNWRLMPSLTRFVGALGLMRYHQPAADWIVKELAVLEPVSRTPAVARITPLSPCRSRSRRARCPYTYEGAAVPALSDVTIRIPRRSMAAFVGRSGAGKSTLVDILIGLHRPSAGAVLVDGRDIAENLASWQSNIGYVPQSVFLTDDTLRRNVAFGIDDAQIDDGAVRRALEAAQLSEFVRGLPAGLDTAVGERGSRLAGGQCQRNGIARALYRDPDVLVLDEPAIRTVGNKGEEGRYDVGKGEG